MLSKRNKERYENETSYKYNQATGKSRVMVLDQGFKAKTISNTSFKDLGTYEDQIDIRHSICTGMGTPPILLDSGNNANIRPNIDMYYAQTIVPALKKFESAIESFFGFDVKLLTEDVLALAPDKKLQAETITSLVNNGIITGDEGRERLRLTPLNTPEMTEIRIPQNVAGSQTGVAGEEGGKPTGTTNTEET